MGLLDGLLDKSILFSFDRTGFERHQQGFDPADLGRSLDGRVCLVTGANAGVLPLQRELTAEGLSGQTGKFWFDRTEAPTHLAAWTRETKAERLRLWDFCQVRAGLE